ncbi:isoflavone reductase [Colletotrichum graminicola]|uniref:Isoflavone reductase n=1 Tax=Colletotrichum graminicola (strain M1.001 / M2 / FGSC 10212) TaxID=645133 RepID=E3Q200_COLGM|nr:isoflavone reductase [Colletotrichum graminicola M1.001]EFQ25101.1 isoflavone reductase [Colletotrichum graminicola M1.001]WDK15292.1 isoflavone reductase [Colletotrichum graminicola]
MAVLVLGAGELGMAMLRSLMAHPSRPIDSSVSVLLRPSTINSPDAEKVELIAKFKTQCISIEAGDLVNDSIQDLAAIFAKYDTVVSCTGFVGPTGTQRRICEAVLLGKVRRFIPWQFGVDHDAIGRGSPQVLFDENIDVRDALRAQREVAWVIISTGLFMTFLFVKDFGVVDFEEKKLRALGGWDIEVTLTNPDDIGKMTAEVIYDPRGIPENGRNVVYISGDTVSYKRAADLVEQRFPEIKFVRENWDMDWLKENLQKDPTDTWNKYRAIFGAGKGVSWPKEATLNSERGIKLQDLETFLRKMETPDTLKI